jgi:hypothetical protein
MISREAIQPLDPVLKQSFNWNQVRLPWADSKMEPFFYTDKDIARRLNLSPSWVRGQRHKRSKKLPHILKIEPRYIGSCPRYVATEVEAFISAIAG